MVSKSLLRKFKFENGVIIIVDILAPSGKFSVKYLRPRSDADLDVYQAFGVSRRAAFQKLRHQIKYKDDQKYRATWDKLNGQDNTLTMAKIMSTWEKFNK